PHAGLHRRPRGRRPRRAAQRRCGRQPGPRAGEPAGARRSCHRPLGAGRRVRFRGGLPQEHRMGVPAQRRALRPAPVGAAGLPLTLPWPSVVGVRMRGALPTGTTATDLVLTLTQLLRARGVVGSFVEFFGAGLSSLRVEDRATLSNMCPEYGATAALFPVDRRSLHYLRETGRLDLWNLVEAYTKEQGLFRTDEDPDPVFNDVLDLDLSTIEPSLAGPRRPQDRQPLPRVLGS